MIVYLVVTTTIFTVALSALDFTIWGLTHLCQLIRIYDKKDCAIPDFP